MSETLPTVVIVLLTYERTEYALATVRSHINNLRYDGRLLWWIADDGSREEHYRSLFHELNDYLIGSHRMKRGYGGSANNAWEYTVGAGYPITYWLEDDWELRKPLDITPYVRLLLEREDVGMVRLGYMPVGLDLESVGHDGRMYLGVKKSKQYAFSGNPHLKHSRFLYAYGAYPDSGLNPGETEIAYDNQVRAVDGPAIWWPLSIGDDPYFGHIGVEQSYEARRP